MKSLFFIFCICVLETDSKNVTFMEIDVGGIYDNLTINHDLGMYIKEKVSCKSPKLSDFVSSVLPISANTNISSF